MTHRYAVYGAGLESTIEFPELHRDDAVPVKWRFDTTGALPEMASAIELGSENIYGDVHARLYRHARGHRISVDDTGHFDMSLDGRHVTWQRRAESWPDFVRSHLLGRVLGTSMYNDGWLPLHGSAVDLREGVAAFLAPKGFGKSSLALALTRAGARLVTDDTLPVEPGRSAGPHAATLAWPGVHSLRVRPDSADALGVTEPGGETREGKRLLADIPAHQRANGPRPLRALYLIDPRLPDAGGAPVERTRLNAMLAAVGVVAHVKIGRMLGTPAAATMLQRAAAITGDVPVYRLHVARDLAALPAIAGAIIAWHGGIA